MDWEYDQLRHYCMEVLFILEKDVTSLNASRNSSLMEYSKLRQQYGYQILEGAFVFVATIDDLINTLIKDAENTDWFEPYTYHDDFQFSYHRRLKSLDKLSNPNNTDVVKALFVDNKDNISKVQRSANGLLYYLVTELKTGYGQYEKNNPDEELAERPDLT